MSCLLCEINKEFSKLSDEEAIKLALIIKNLKKGILKALNPDKINIALLGNMVAHLHIHIIPIYKNDPWWPNAIFCEKKKVQLSSFLMKKNIKMPSFNV